jgi:hypothetical protein
MARVRLTPSLQPSTGVRDQYETSVAKVYSSGIGQALQGVANVMGIYADYKKADKANQFTQYKSDLALIQKETQAEMSLAPDSETRRSIMKGGEDRMRQLGSEFEYKNDNDVQQFNNTFLKNYNITSKGLWGKLEIEEQKFALDQNTTKLATADIPMDMAIAEHERLLEGTTGTIISDQEAQLRRENFKQTLEKQYMDNSSLNMYSLSNIANSIDTIAFDSPEDLVTANEGLNHYYNENKEQVRESSLSETEKNQRIANIDKAQAQLPVILNSKYAKQQTETITDSSRIINEIYDKPVVSAEDNQHITNMINSIADANTRESVEKIFASKQKVLTARKQSEIKMRSDRADLVVTKAKTLLAAGEVSKPAMLKSIEQKLFKHKKSEDGTRVIKTFNEQLTPDELDKYSTLYTQLANDTDEVLKVTEGVVRTQKANNLLPSMTDSQVRVAVEEHTDEDWEDLTPEERIKGRIAVTKENRDYTEYFSDRLYKLIDSYYLKNNRLPEGEDLDTLTLKAQQDSLEVNFINNTLSDSVRTDKRKVKKAEKPKRREYRPINPVTGRPY